MRTISCDQMHVQLCRRVEPWNMVGVIMYREDEVCNNDDETELYTLYVDGFISFFLSFLYQ